MLHGYQKAVSVSKRQRDSTRTPIDFDLWFEDVHAAGTESGHSYGDRHRLAEM